MIGSKRNGYYTMSEVQFEEMKNFYKKLGYNPLQVKVLTERCFGNSIVVSKDVPYRNDWCFPLRIDYNTPPAGGIFKNMPFQRSMPGASMSAFQSRMTVSAVPNMASPTGSVRSNQPVQAQRMVSKRNMSRSRMINLSELYEAELDGAVESFDTAETHVNDENEKLSPLNSPQAIFSANVNTASWDYLRGKIEQRSSIDKSFNRKFVYFSKSYILL